MPTLRFCFARSERVMARSYKCWLQFQFIERVERLQGRFARTNACQRILKSNNEMKKKNTFHPIQVILQHSLEWIAKLRWISSIEILPRNAGGAQLMTGKGERASENRRERKGDGIEIAILTVRWYRRGSSVSGKIHRNGKRWSDILSYKFHKFSSLFHSMSALFTGYIAFSLRRFASVFISYFHSA